MPTDPDGHPAAPDSSVATPDGTAVRGADLARQVLAQAKKDSRERVRGGRAGGRARRGSFDAASDTAGQDGAGSGCRGESAGRSGSGAGPGGAAGGGRARRDGDEETPPRRPRLPGIASPGRDWREPVAFSSAITRLLSSRGWRAQAADASVISRWDAIVGPDIADHCAPVSLREGHLELVAESTAWATQLRMLSRQILAILHKELGPQAVQRITVRGPTAPSWRHGPMRTQGRGPRDTYG